MAAMVLVLAAAVILVVFVQEAEERKTKSQIEINRDTKYTTGLNYQALAFPYSHFSFSIYPPPTSLF